MIDANATKNMRFCPILSITPLLLAKAIFAGYGKKEDATEFVETGGHLAVIHIIASHSAPVDEETATPRIRQFMINQRSNKAIAWEMNQLI